MLKGIDPLLGADLLYVLRAMGHGDDLVLADADFPGATMARRAGPTGRRERSAVLQPI